LFDTISNCPEYLLLYCDATAAAGGLKNGKETGRRQFFVLLVLIVLVHTEPQSVFNIACVWRLARKD
jgi:hypothetical protein